MGFTQKLDPRTWFTTNLDDESKTETALTPVNDNMAITDERGKEAQVVQGTFVPTIDATGNMEAKREAARLRAKIEEFDEDKQAWSEWVIIKLFTAMAYTMPVLTAWVVGLAIGDAFSGSFNWSSNYSVYSHIISVFFEMCLPMLGLAVTRSVKRAAKDKSQMWVAGVLGFMFVALAAGNAFATMYLVETHVKLASDDVPGHVAVWFRAFGPLVIDLSATIFLSIVTLKSLQKFLLDMQAKAAGIQSVARSEIAVQAAFDQAAIDKENAANQQERNRMDNELLRQLTMKRNRDTLGDDDGRKGRYGGW